MNLLNPEALLLIFVIILIYLFSKKYYKTNLFSNEILSKLTISKTHTKVDSYLILSATVLLIIALSRPVIIIAPTEIEVKQKDIVIAIDLSHSMSANDLNPNRFEVAKNKLNEFLKFSNNRHAILGFTSNALILSPPTSDKELLYYLFDSFDLNNIITKSTKIMPILKQTNRIIKSREKILIIFSDGGDEQSFIKEIEFANENNIKVFVLGVATKEGGILKDEQDKIIKNDFENIVVSSLNEEIKELCFATGGDFIEVSKNSSDIKNLAKLVSKFESNKKTKERRYDYQELFYYFLITAFILFFIATTTIKIDKIKNFKFMLLIFLNIFLINSYAGLLDFYFIDNGVNSYKKANFKEASEYFKNLDSNEGLYNLANSYYKSSEYKLAIRAYQKVKSNDRVFKSKVFYNLANALVKIKNYELAKKFYTNSLILHYSQDAYFNRELIKNLKNRDLLNKNKSKNSKKKNINKSKNNSNKTKKGNAEVLLKPNNHKRPFSFKEYQSINRGKVNEKNPW